MRKDHDESKLPLWAQSELRRLRSNLAHAERKLGAGPESRVCADPYSSTPRYLADDTKVEFRLGADLRAKIQVRIEDDALYVYGGDSISFHPDSSNTGMIKVSTRG